MKNNSLTFIFKLIELTKNKGLLWEKVSLTNIPIKPLPSSPLNNSLVPEVSFSDTLSAGNSYVCSHGSGQFFLLLYSNPLLSTRLELRAQTNDSECSQLYASYKSSGKSDEDVTISSQLKRLYNLVDATRSTEDIDSFVDNFIDGL